MNGNGYQIQTFRIDNEIIGTEIKKDVWIGTVVTPSTNIAIFVMITLHTLKLMSMTFSTKL